jgi:hypothetical protein
MKSERRWKILVILQWATPNNWWAIDQTSFPTHFTIGLYPHFIFFSPYIILNSLLFSLPCHPPIFFFDHSR